MWHLFLGGGDKTFLFLNNSNILFKQKLNKNRDQLRMIRIKFGDLLQ